MKDKEQEKPREVTVVVDNPESLEKVALELKKLGVKEIKPLENIGCITGRWDGALETIQEVENVAEVEAPTFSYEAIDTDSPPAGLDVPNEKATED